MAGGPQIAGPSGAVSVDLLDACNALWGRREPLHAWSQRGLDVAVHVAASSVWIYATLGATTIALRALRDPALELEVRHVLDGDRVRIEASSRIAAYRVEIAVRQLAHATAFRATAAMLPVHDLLLNQSPRDLYVLPSAREDAHPEGHLYTAQRGLQTGSLFGVVASEQPGSFFYFQNFTALTSYFRDTQTTPGDTVGGEWPVLGFALPIGQKQPLLAGNEYTLSDVCLVVRPEMPGTDGQAASHYLEALAHTVATIEHPPVEYHNWPAKARATVFDLSRSPACSYAFDGERYLTPYAGDTSKPPESMVQLTVLVSLLELAGWEGGEAWQLSRDLLHGMSAFFDPRVGSVVRWLPGAPFVKREDERQTHDSMDSWYLYQVLFNLSRLALAGNAAARSLLERSLPFAIRVANRFAYRWPIFFSLATLDVIQTEAVKGSGGENDVAGLYALLMLNARELFGDVRYAREAEQAALSLQGLRFGIAYQLNTTGYAAKAMLRLYQLTGDERYKELGLVCMANIFDNTALWECKYGYESYGTFFGLYPLLNAPYVAAYEEVEMLANFHEYMHAGGEAVAPAVQLLMAEYCRHLLSRAWRYFPSELPPPALAKKPRNGIVSRSLEIPLEDLRSGREQSGQVGQEIYGAGLAMVCVTRHYHHIRGWDALLFCDYPLRARSKDRFVLAGDSRMHCRVRLIPNHPDARLDERALEIAGSRCVKAERSIEGHIVADVPGGSTVIVKAPR